MALKYPTSDVAALSEGSCRPDSKSHRSWSLRSNSPSSAATSLSEMPAPRASRKRVRIRSFSSMPRRQRQRRRLSVVASIALDGTLDQQFANLADCARRVEPLGADVDAVHDGVTAEQSIRIIEIVEPLA